MTLGDNIEDVREHIGALDISPLPPEEPVASLPDATTVRQLAASRSVQPRNPPPVPDAVYQTHQRLVGKTRDKKPRIRCHNPSEGLADPNSQ